MHFDVKLNKKRQYLVTLLLSVSGIHNYITFEGLKWSGNLASVLFRVSSLPGELFLCSMLLSLLLPLMVSVNDPAVDKDLKSFSGCKTDTLAFPAVLDGQDGLEESVQLSL